MKATLAAALLALASASPAVAQAGVDRVTTDAGVVEGLGAQGSGVRLFRGIPFAQPPLGALRWRAPEPAEKWDGVRQAKIFGAACMQTQLAFTDMVSRARGISEDCLYLNVWTPAKTADAKLPVLVYIYGGGFMGGDGSELRYDGESMASKGMVVVTLNYRLGVFGFLSTAELSKESGYGGSGDYGLLDQQAALGWVQRNIAAFGGDPARVTIAGESAGSISVSALMASPLSKGLFAGAIGQSGSIMGSLDAVPLADAEKTGAEFLSRVGAGSVSALRAMTADQVAALATASRLRFAPSVDGHFLPKPAAAIYDAGEHMRVPLLAGSNSQEAGAGGVLGAEAPTVENYRKALARLYPDAAQAAAAFAAYPAASDGEAVLDAAQALAGDRFIGFSTWRWMDAASKSGGRPTFYYYYAHPRPPMPAVTEQRYRQIALSRNPNAPPPAPVRGAVHAGEIEYALGNLDSNTVFVWTPEDRAVSATMQGYFANFIKTGDPNGAGLAKWPAYNKGRRMVIDVKSRAAPQAPVSKRYQFLNGLYNMPR